jgi:hypothetical protein
MSNLPAAPLYRGILLAEDLGIVQKILVYSGIFKHPNKIKTLSENHL